MYEPRRPGPLVIDESLRATLAQLRAQRRIAAVPTLSPKDVAIAEHRLGRAVRDDVWALVAALGRQPSELPAHTEVAVAQAYLPAGLIVIDHDGRTTHWCVRSEPRLDAPLRVVQWSARQRRVVRRWPSLDAFIRARFGLRNDGPIGKVGGSAGPTFVPRLATATDGPSLRRVHHLHFGDGIVVDEIFARSHKLEVDFEGCGRKLVLASYVRELETGWSARAEADASAPSTLDPAVEVA